VATPNAINLGQGHWNSQASSPGLSGNVPVQPITSGNFTPPTAPVPFWDSELTQGLDPANGNVSPWDTVKLGGWTLPGRASVDSTRGRRIDVKKVKGQHYATLTFNGYDPARITINLSIWTQGQLDMLAAIMPVLEAPPAAYADGTFDALDIVHPSLQLRNITQVLIEEIGSLKASSIKGVWDLKIRCLEYKRIPKAPASATATGSAYNVKTAISTQGALITPGNDLNFTGPP